MLAKMDNLGVRRLGFSLYRRPPCWYRPRKRGGGEPVPVFEPYEGNLPLEAGYYTFVIDAEGRFHLRRGNVSSHSAMIGGGDSGAAGWLRINRAGHVAEISCLSQEYSLNYLSPSHKTVKYLVEFFVAHPAFELSHHAIFRFRRGGVGNNFYVNVEGEQLDRPEDYLRLADAEGYGTDLSSGFSQAEREAFGRYQPIRPPRLYAMHHDQLITSIEDESDVEPFTVGEAKPRYGPELPKLGPGKKAFVLDREGWLIVGDGHHLLSGGQDVGAAGQVVVDAEGTIHAINLNFSGHYRPPLDVVYARYTYRSLAAHPLLCLGSGCVISGRKTSQDELGPMLRFLREELIDDSFPLDEMIDNIEF